MKTISKYLGCLFFVAVVSGCATSTPAVQYAQANRVLAENGQIAWSTYYIGLYDAIARSNLPNRGQLMERVNGLILAAKSYEAGTMTRDQFDYVRRAAQADSAKDMDAENARRVASTGEFLKQLATQPEYVPTQPARRTTTTNCLNTGGSVNCESTTR